MPDYISEADFLKPQTDSGQKYISEEDFFRPERTMETNLQDVAATAAKGITGAGDAAIGLLNIPTLGQAGRAKDLVGLNEVYDDPMQAEQALSEHQQNINAGERNQFIDASPYSEPQQYAQQQVTNAEGLVGKFGAAIRNPSTIVTTVGESLPTMGAGGLIGRAVTKAAPLISPIVGGAIGEGLVGAGSAAEQTRKETATGTLSPTQAAMAVGSGLGTAAFGYAGGKIANKLGFNDVDTLFASGFSRVARNAGVDAGEKGFARTAAEVAGRIAGGGISEGLFEELPQSVQETLWQNAALGKPLAEGLDESAVMGFLSGAAMGGPVNALPRPKAVTPPESVLNAQSVDDAIASASAELDTDLRGLVGTAGLVGALSGEIDEQRRASMKYNQDSNALGQTPQSRADLMGTVTGEPVDGIEGAQRIINEDSLERNQYFTPNVTEENSLLAQGEATPAIQRAELEADYRELFSGPTVLSDSAEQRLSILERKLNEGQTGERFQRDDGSWDGVKSTNQEWLKSGPLKEVGKAGIATVIAKARNGEPMTDRQRNIWMEIKKAADWEWENDHDTVVAREAEKIQKQTGIELDVPNPMPAGNLQEGDKAVVLDKNGIPDVVTHKGWTADGQVRLKDGVEIVVDPWEPIQTMGVQINEDKWVNPNSRGDNAEAGPVRRAQGDVQADDIRADDAGVKSAPGKAGSAPAEVLPRDIGASRPAEITGDREWFIRDQQIRSESTATAPIVRQPGEKLSAFLKRRKEEKSIRNEAMAIGAVAPGGPTRDFIKRRKVSVSQKAENDTQSGFPLIGETQAPTPSANPAQTSDNAGETAKEPWEMDTWEYRHDGQRRQAEREAERTKSHQEDYKKAQAGDKSTIDRVWNELVNSKGRTFAIEQQNQETGETEYIYRRGISGWKYKTKDALVRAELKRRSEAKPGFRIFDQSGEMHRRLVDKALKEGKPVPQKVLDEYPDIAEKYGKKPVEADAGKRDVPENDFGNIKNDSSQVKENAASFTKPTTFTSTAAQDGADNPTVKESLTVGKQVHDFSNTQVDVKGDAAKKIIEFGKRIPDRELYTEADDDSYGREEEPHVTVRYGLATDDPKEISGLSALQPIAAKMGKVSIFEADKYDVVKVEIISPALTAANKKVGELVDLPGETFKDYQPHATIAYVKKGEGAKYVGDITFEGVEVSFDAINLTDRKGKTHSIKLQQGTSPRSGDAAVQDSRTGKEGEQPSTSTQGENNGEERKGKGRQRLLNDTTTSELKKDTKNLNIDPEVKETAPAEFAGNKVFTSDKVAAARERLKAKRGTLSSGFDPELMQDLLVIGGAHFEAGVRNFSAWAKAVMADIGTEFKPFLRGTYENLRHYPGIEKDGMSTATDTDAINLDEITTEPDNTGKEQTQEGNNVAQLDSNTDLERDSQDAGTTDGVGKKSVRDGSRRTGATGRTGVRGTAQEDRAGDSEVDSGPETATAGERGDQSPYSTNGESVPAESDAGSDNDRRGGDAGDGGQQPDRIAAETVRAAAQKGSERQSKVEEQRKSAKIKTIKGDLANIQETLPLLKPGQQTDVLFAEQRFSKPDGHGVLFTNGTGTGKTFSALGIIKRFERDGKKNILIIAPDNVIIDAWSKAAKSFFDIDLHKLEDTKQSGSGITVTTYANFRDNQTLAKRNWDLIVADESHELNMNKDGKATASQNMFQAVSLHPRGAYDRAKHLHTDLWQRVEDLAHELRLANTSDNQQDWDRIPGLEKKLDAAHSRWKEKLEEVKAQIASAQKDGTRPKVVFLSATPFAYEKNVDYAEGYLFDYGPTDTGGGYNSGGAFERFMMQHFGYRMRTNKLTEPEQEVNRGLMQRQFNSWLKKEGALSSRVLDVDYDYDRRFVLVESAVGQKIDEGLQYLYEEKRFMPLWQAIQERFDFLTRRYLLEAIKANEIVPVIKEHLAQGRKVVVFHDYIKGGATNPFDLRHLLNSQDNVAIDGGDLVKLGDLVQEFMDARPDLANLPIKNLPSPLSTLTSAFPDLMVVNGQTVNKDQRQANINAFNDDATGPAVLMVQSDKDKGWSGHDTTGKHQRVLINLGLPTRPTRAIQQEGRIYRVGQASDAIIRYVNTGTNWERWAFASTIAQRASAAENLAMGEEARALQDSFIQAFEESDTYPPGFEGEGKGGKERDAASNAALSEWDRATALYYSNQKKTSRTKAEEGKDYFATPEPLGLKMVEWANIKGGDDVLEPSAGHGAIARWFPDNTTRTVVEPSSALASRLKMVTADAKLVQDQFENLNIVNKYDAIIMNPPFGTAGKTAMDHIEKAYRHLRDGGRIVALIPSGTSMDKRLDKFLYGTDAKGKSVNPDVHLVAEFMLPSTTFERAGTSVNARVVILDKIGDNELAGKIRQQSPRDYSGDYPVKEFFERIENVSAPDRINVKQEEKSQAAGALEEYGVKVEENDDDKFPFKVTGKTYPYRNLIKNLVDAKSRKWDGYQKAWIFKEDPTALLAEQLADEPKYSVAGDAEQEAPTTPPTSTPDTVKAEISSKLGRFRTMQLLRRGVLNIVGSQEEAKRIIGEARAKLSAAWHGSPHDFEKFKTSAIGTGEGAQVYGYGLYFASAKEVAEHYRENLSGGVREILDATPRKDPAGYAAGVLYASGETKDALEAIQASPEMFGLKMTGDELLKAGRERLAEVKKRGRIYQVELAPQEDEYLLWDKPLSEQSEKVKAALAPAIERYASQLGKYGWKKEDVATKKNGADLYSAFGSRARVGVSLGSDKSASEYLYSLGIRGIKYLDGTSRGKGEGAHNYVIFDENDVEIQVKYSKSGAIQGFALNGKSYLVADGIQSGEGWQVFLHEITHLSRLGLNQGQFNQLLNTIDRHRGKDTVLGKAIAKAEARIPEDTLAEYRSEEILSYLIEQDKTEVGIVRRFIAMVKAALVKMGISPNIFKAEDFKALAVNAAKWQSTMATGSNVMQSVARPILEKHKVTSTPLKGMKYTGNQEAIDNLVAGTPVDLIREPNNPADENAVKVQANGVDVGYVSRGIAKNLAKRMDAGEDVRGVVAFAAGKGATAKASIVFGKQPDLDGYKAAMRWDEEGERKRRVEEERILGQQYSDALKDVLDNGLSAASEADLFNSMGKRIDLVDTADASTGTKLWDWFKSLPKAVARRSLGAMTLMQLREVYADKIPEMGAYFQATRDIGSDSTRIMSKAQDVYDNWVKLGKEPAKKMSEVMIRATVAGVNPDAASFEARANIMRLRQSMNKNLNRISDLRKNGADLLTDDETTELNTLEIKVKQQAERIENEVNRRREYTAIKATYDALPADAKAVYQAVKGMYTSNLNDLFDALSDRISRQVKDPALRKTTIDTIREKYDKYLQEGPYFPLSRFGDYIAIAEKDGKREVRTFDGLAERTRYTKERRAQGWTVQEKTAKEYSRETQGASGSFVTGLVSAIEDNESLGTAEKKNLIDEVNQHFIKALPDLSHRKHFAHRRKIEGYNRDQMRAFADNMQHAAHHIARIRHADKMTTSVEAILEKSKQQEGDVNVDDMTDLHNELVKRLAIMNNPNISPVAQAITSFGFLMNIGPSIASAVTNMSQTPLVAFPILSTYFEKQGAMSAFNALRKASADYFTSKPRLATGPSLIDNEKLPKNERDAIAALIDDGTIETSMAMSIAQAAGEDFLNLARTKHGNVALRVMKLASYPFHVAELANRKVTALAAYRMAREEGQDHNTAVNTTRELVLQSHFDYSRHNRARFMEGNVQRVLFLFKQYSQQMTWLLGRTFWNSAKGETQEVKDAARKRLGMILTGHFMVAGAMGLPVLGSVLSVISMLGGDDDEPLDAEVSLRNWLADNLGKDAGEAIMKGPWRLLPGLGELDIASRVSLGDLWFRAPDREAEGRDKFNQYVNLVLGPIASNAANVFMGVNAMANGDNWRGVEMMLPKAVKDGMKMVRYSRDGVQNWKHDTLIEDMKAVELMGQALGFTPSRVSEMYSGANAVKNRETILENRRQSLMNKWVQATRTRDSEAAKEAIDAIVRFNSKNPVFRVTPQSLRSSLRNRLKAQGNTKQGVYLPATKNELRQYGRFAQVE